jgi:uncharacterized membrane protein YphA (DoxX/SURF4 family)
MQKQASSGGRRAAVVLLRGITIFLALLFLVEGGTKLFLDAKTVATFHKWGYPAWLVFAVGLLEFPGAALIVIPRLALLGTALMAVDMVGAIVTGVVQGIVPIILFSACILLLVVLVGWTRRKRFIWWPLLQHRFLNATTVREGLPETAGLTSQKEPGNG